MGKKRVFDLETEKHHEYFANGMLVHNCNYHSILDDAAQKQGTEELYKVKDTFVMYRPAAIRMAPQSPSTRTLRGSTRISYTVDEMGHFSENKELVNISGIEVWNALQNSLQTIRAETYRLRKEKVVAVPPALAMAISSPRDVADPIMVLHKAHASADDSYVMLRPTWEANPRQTFERLAKEKKTDTVSLWRDYGCRPPLSENGFITSPDYLFDVINRSHLPAISQKTIPITKGTNKRVVTLRLRHRWMDHNVPKVMAFDAGKELNAFAAAIGHLNEDGIFEYDAFVEIRPRPGMPVSFSEAYKNVIAPIIEKHNVRAIVADRWESSSILDQAQDDYKVVTGYCRLKYSDFQDWRDALLNNMIVLPKPEIENQDIIDVNRTEEEYFDDKPVAQLIRQSVRVVDEPGKTVSKPSTGNDDVFRSAVEAFTAITIPEIAKVIRPGRLKRGGVGALGVNSVATIPSYIQQPMAVGTSPRLSFPKGTEVVPVEIDKPNPVRKDRRSLDGVNKIREVIPPKPLKRRK